MCLLTVRSTDNRDGTIQQDDPPTSCKDGRQDFNIQQFSSIEKHEREASTSNIKTPCSIRNKLEAAINLDRSLNADAVEDEDLGERRATFESADGNLKTQMLQNETNNLKEDHPKLAIEKDKMCLKTSSAQGEIQQENQLTPCRDCSTDIHVRHFFVNYQNEECTDQHNALQHPSAISKHAYTYSTAVKNAFSLLLYFHSRTRAWINNKGISQRKLMKMILKDKFEITEHILGGKRQRELTKLMLEDKVEITEHILGDAEGIFSKKLLDVKKKIKRMILEEMREKERERKEHIRMLFMMLLLVMLIKSISENFQCRQTSSRKYPCLNSILYLLWQSGDVEANPGPPANSTTYRNWLFDTCSVVRKAIAGVPAECKMYNIWKKKPENWPQGELYFDPRNRKGLTVNMVEHFLKLLIHCCDTSKLSSEINSEIKTWNSHQSKDNDKLIHLYRMRGCLKSTEQVNRSLKVLQSHLLPDEVLTVEVDTFIRISLSFDPTTDQQCIIHKIYRAEAIRKIVLFLGEILNINDWTKKPDWCPKKVRFFNPNNGGKRCAKNEDAKLLETMITRCEQKSIILQKPHQDMVEALRADDQMLLSKLMTRHSAETDLKKTVIKMHKDGFLQDLLVAKHLRELGLLIQCDGSIQNAKSQKRKMVDTTNKHKTKRMKQRDHYDILDTTVKEFSIDCSIGQLLDNQSDSFLLDTIGQHIPDFLGDEADDIQFQRT